MGEEVVFLESLVFSEKERKRETDRRGVREIDCHERDLGSQRACGVLFPDSPCPWDDGGGI